MSPQLKEKSWTIIIIIIIDDVGGPDDHWLAIVRLQRATNKVTCMCIVYVTLCN